MFASVQPHEMLVSVHEILNLKLLETFLKCLFNAFHLRISLLLYVRYHFDSKRSRMNRSSIAFEVWISPTVLFDHLIFKFQKINWVTKVSFPRIRRIDISTLGAHILFEFKTAPCLSLCNTFREIPNVIAAIMPWWQLDLTTWRNNSSILQSVWLILTPFQVFVAAPDHS